MEDKIKIGGIAKKIRLGWRVGQVLNKLGVKRRGLALRKKVDVADGTYWKDSLIPCFSKSGVGLAAPGLPESL